MSFDPSYIEQNRASTQRIRALAGRLSAEQLQTRVGADWTVAIALVHLAFWDRRTLSLLEQTEREGKLSAPAIDVVVNDLSLPFWAAIPPRAAAQLALEAAEALDQRLENFPPALLEAVNAGTPRWVNRGLHRSEHLDEIEAALKP